MITTVSALSQTLTSKALTGGEIGGITGGVVGGFLILGALLFFLFGRRIPPPPSEPVHSNAIIPPMNTSSGMNEGEGQAMGEYPASGRLRYPQEIHEYGGRTGEYYGSNNDSYC